MVMEQQCRYSYKQEVKTQEEVCDNKFVTHQGAAQCTTQYTVSTVDSNNLLYNLKKTRNPNLYNLNFPGAHFSLSCLGNSSHTRCTSMSSALTSHKVRERQVCWQVEVRGNTWLRLVRKLQLFFSSFSAFLYFYVFQHIIPVLLVFLISFFTFTEFITIADTLHSGF